MSALSFFNWGRWVNDGASCRLRGPFYLLDFSVIALVFLSRGMSSGSTSTFIDLAWPGTRQMRPFSSSRTTIWWMVGNDVWKKLQDRLQPGMCQTLRCSCKWTPGIGLACLWTVRSSRYPWLRLNIFLLHFHPVTQWISSTIIYMI